MKKICCLLITIVLFVSSFTNFAYADTKDTAGDTQVPPTIYSQDEINKIREIHNQVVKQELITLNSDGTITVNADCSKLGVTEDIYEKYIQSVEDINDIIGLGVATFDKNFKLNVISKDAAVKVISERDKKRRQEGIISNNKFDTNRSIGYSGKLGSNFKNTDVSSASNKLASFQLGTVQSSFIQLNTSTIIANLFAYTIATRNYWTLEDYFSALYVYSPMSACVMTIAYWISKVQEGGDWDYKVVDGYAPYYTQWNAVQRYTTSIKTSEWFGNYNYGFTGRYLFSLSILLAGGDTVSLVFNHAIDDTQDRTDITQGYNEAA